jgi:hypothetical protein
MFEEDDEETWKLLVSLKPNDADLTSRLKSLAQRLDEDASTSATSYWDDLISRLQSNGFRYSTAAMNPLKKASASTSEIPSAFQSDLGKKHLQATSALLGLSERRAVQLTMSALRSVDSDGSQFQSLLGSRNLLIKTMLHHQQQRLARLGVLTECLRLEQDPEAVQRDAIVGLLDTLDATYPDGDRYRGLFRRLLTIACAPEAAPTREQLEPAKALKATTSISLQDSMASGEKGWTAFCSTILEESREQCMRERTEAMESLVVLLYERINGGVRRADFALLLIAFQTSFQFFTDLPNGQRLSKLAGLICAEAMALWRIFEHGADLTEGWAPEHPLFLGVLSTGNTQAAENEIESLRKMLLDYAEASLSRNMESEGEAPESLALISFGLLLCLAYDSILSSETGGDGQAYWRTFKAIGIDMAQTANDTCGAFDYMYSVIDSLTSEAPASQSSAAHDQPYDWQFSSTKSNPLLLESGPQEDSAPDTTAYTSIAREILAASVSAFENTILAIDQENSFDNIGLLCNLAAVIYQNNPLLCQQFWGDWESYISPDSPSSPFPICCLMDASHKLAVAALDAYNNSRLSDETFIPATAPFFRLLSSLSHAPHVVETTVGMLPEGMVRKALLSCRLAAAASGSEAYNKSRIVLLEAVSTLARIGNSKSCLEKLRLSLEEVTRGPVLVDGPRVLARVLSATNDSNITKSVLCIMAHLLDGAPQRWALQLAREFIASHDSQSGLGRFLAPGSDTTHAAALVLSELIEHLTAVVFCDSFNDNDAMIFLHSVTTGLLAAGATLASSLSVATASLTGGGPFSFETAQTIMQSFSNFLKLIRTVMELHKSSKVRETAMELRDSVINTLATSTGLGQAIAYYATAPVSLSLVIKLQSALEDQSILQQVAAGSDAAASNAEKYGAWQSVLSQHTQNPSDHLAKQFLIDAIAKLKSDEFDLEGIQARRWTSGSDKLAPLHTAWSAIRLVSLWASHVEDIVKTHVGSLNIQSMPLTGPAKDLVNSLSPQRLLASLAPSPMPCRHNGSLANVWESVGLSTFELLLPYLSENDQEEPSASAIPSLATLDLLHACLIHTRSVCSQETVADSMLFSAVYRSSRFSDLLVDSVERTLALSSRGSLQQTDKAEILNGLLSLRVLGTTVEASPTVADTMLRLEKNSIVPSLVKNASKAKELLGLVNGGSQGIFASEESIVQMRVATGCLAVLSSLWTTARTISPSQTDSAGSRLVKALDDQTAFVTELVTIVTGYANATDLESCIVPSRESECARCTMITYASIALDILATELAYDVCNREKNKNSALENLLLNDFIQSKRFIGFEGYQLAAESSIMFASAGIAEVSQPTDVLECFPSTSNNLLSRDFYARENAFDVSSILHWLCESGSKDEDDIEDIVTKLSISYQLASCDLQIMTSWRSFAEMLVFFAVEKAEGSGSFGPSAERLFHFAQDTLQALNQNIESVNKAQVEVSEAFMSAESKRMAKYLTELFLFFLEMGAGMDEGKTVLAFDDLLGTLDLLTRTSETILAVSSPGPSHVSASLDAMEVGSELIFNRTH